MPIDKTWTKLANRLSVEFSNGLNAFIERCKEHLSQDGQCRCPCEKCHNRRWHYPNDIHRHVQRWGFTETYTTWKYHGEVVPQVVYDTSNEMVDALNDVRWENTSNEQNTNVNEPTEGPSALHDDIDELFALADTELYPGCTWMSSLDFLAKISHMKVLNKWTDSSFDQLLELLKTAFPKDNKIPSSHYEAKKMMKTIGLGYESIHACKNDCCLFWKENEGLQSCPICGESRWKDKDTMGMKVAYKVLRYFPLTSRLKRMYSSRHTAKFMTWHATGRLESGKMRHPVDGKAWKDFDERFPEFASEIRNIRLGLAADGFNPYGNMSLAYSMWPVILTTYNLPPWLCMKESSFMLTLLIPGPKSPGKDIDIFLRPLVDELKSLWSDGVQTRDAATNTLFTMRAMLLWTINDFLARSSLSGWSGQGYKACPTCNEDTPSCRVLGKTAYVGHRRFLRSNHPWRYSKMFDGKIDKTSRPRQFNNNAILQQLDQLPLRIPGKHPSFGGVKRKCDANELKWSKRSIFFELDYWSSLQLKHNLDVMHIEKNVCESLLGTLLMNDKSKDTNNARIDLKILNIRNELWLKDRGNGKSLKPHPRYSFTIDGRRRFCQFIKGVKLPDGFGSNFKRKVTDNESNITGMKSHDCHIMMQRLLPVGVRGYLDPSISTPIVELCAFFKQICARNLMEADMMKAERQLVNILCTFEQIFPPAFFDIMVHSVMHLPEEAIQGGPVYMRWMYPFERYMKKLKNYVRNKARPEGSIAEGYIADEALTFCSLYLRGVQTRFNRADRTEDAPIQMRTLRVFQSQCTPISKCVHTKLDYPLRKKVEWYVLNNSPDIDQYKNEFTTIYPGNDLQRDFPGWFKNKIRCLRVAEPPGCSSELLALANGPSINANSYTACIVNGVRFVVHSRDTRRTTQNSGVSTPGVDGCTFYGQLEDILELNYSSGCNVVLFKCKWFNTNNTTRTQRCVTKNNITSICKFYEWFKDEPYILATQAKQVFYLDDPSSPQHWIVIQEVNHRKIWDRETILEEHEQDVIHDSNSSDLALDANLDSLTYMSLNRDGQSTEVSVNHVIDDADDFIDDEDDDAHTIEDSENEDLEPDNECEPSYCSSDESD